MSTSVLYRALGIRGYKHRSIRQGDGVVVVRARHDASPLTCPACGGANIRHRGTVPRRWSAPPIPAGLGDLTDPLQDLAEFYEIPDELIAAAAKQSPPAPAGVDPDKLFDGWLRKQKKADLQKIVREFLSDEPAVVRSRIMAGTRDGRETVGWPVMEVRMTFGELTA